MAGTERSVRIPMVDGVELAVSLYLPDAADPQPCLLEALPYRKDDLTSTGYSVGYRSLRILAFDRVPWPRPDLLHKARRLRFGGEGAGGRNFDDALARAKMAQAFGRLIRRADDKGVFVMLDAAAPTRLFASLPPGTEVQRMGLAEAVEQVAAFLQPASDD